MYVVNFSAFIDLCCNKATVLRENDD